jgi:hypothetical protein
MEYLLVIYSSISSLSVLLLCFFSRHYDFSPIYCDKIIKTCLSVPRLWYQKIKIRGMELLGFFVISMAIITVFLVDLL